MELDELYQDILLDHYRHPRNAAPVPDDRLQAEEINPSCGDHIRLAAEIGPDGRLVCVRHESTGCAISTASASMMSEFVRGRTPAEVIACADRFTAMMRDETPFDPMGDEDLHALEGVKKFPLRVKCATMCWHALKKALEPRA